MVYSSLELELLFTPTPPHMLSGHTVSLVLGTGVSSMGIKGSFSGLDLLERSLWSMLTPETTWVSGHGLLC